MTRLLRLAAAAAMLGGIVQIAATAAEPELSDDPPAALATLAGNAFWHADRVLDVLSFLLVLFALAVFARTVGDRGRPWARTGLTFLAILGGLGLAAVLTQVSLRAVADAWSSATPEARVAHQAVYVAVNEIEANLFAGAFLAFGAFLALFGAGILADRTRRWLGIALYVISVLLVAGTLGLLATDAAFLLILAGMGLFDVLIIVMGFLLWPRRTSNARSASSRGEAILAVTPGGAAGAMQNEGVEP
jgi:hypothetical protein